MLDDDEILSETLTGIEQEACCSSSFQAGWLFWILVYLKTSSYFRISAVVFVAEYY